LLVIVIVIVIVIVNGIDYRAATDVMSDVVSKMDPFELELRTVGVFPKWSKPRVVCISLSFELILLF
jgi:2'-5' RNA ligase